MHFLRAALCYQRCSAPRAVPNSAGSGLYSYVFRKRKSHLGYLGKRCGSNKVEWADSSPAELFTCHQLLHKGGNFYMSLIIDVF